MANGKSLPIYWFLSGPKRRLESPCPQRPLPPFSLLCLSHAFLPLTAPSGTIPYHWTSVQHWSSIWVSFPLHLAFSLVLLWSTEDLARKETPSVHQLGGLTYYFLGMPRKYTGTLYSGGGITYHLTCKRSKSFDFCQCCIPIILLAKILNFTPKNKKTKTTFHQAGILCLNCNKEHLVLHF
jgi:hypothetical protein